MLLCFQKNFTVNTLILKFIYKEDWKIPDKFHNWPTKSHNLFIDIISYKYQLRRVLEINLRIFLVNLQLKNQSQTSSKHFALSDVFYLYFSASFFFYSFSIYFDGVSLQSWRDNSLYIFRVCWFWRGGILPILIIICGFSHQFKLVVFQWSLN